jgi:hypothetical protein
MRSAPTVFIDAAHNPAGAEVLATALAEEFDFRYLVGVISVMADKDVAGILAALEPVLDQIVVTHNGSARALDVEALAWRVFSFALVEVIQPREWRQLLGITGPGKDPVRLWAEGQWPEIAGRTQDEIDAAAIACAALRKVEVVA